MVTLTWAPQARAPGKALSFPSSPQALSPVSVSRAEGLPSGTWALSPKGALAWTVGPAPSQSSEAGNLQGSPEPVFLRGQGGSEAHARALQLPHSAWPLLP